MTLRDGTAAVLSAVVVAGLAVGLGFGAHAILPAVDASPSASPTPTQGTQGGDFCALMEDMAVDMDQMGELLVGSLFLTSVEGMSEAEVLDILHEFGQAFIDATGTVNDDLLRAAELVTDSESATAFTQMAHAIEGMGQAWGMTALEAESVEAYELAMEAVYLDPEFVAIIDEGDEAEPIVVQYVDNTCGIDLNGDSGTSADTALKTDVSTLGKEMATYYVDWSPGDPQPVITVSENEYYLNGVLIGTQSTGVALTDQYALGTADWCVEVSSEDDSELVFSYSATQGIQSGTCASL